jgi:quercetin dioxygenase-like cupin family protein
MRLTATKGRMAKTGDNFSLPDGITFTIRKSVADTGGEYVETQMTFPPGTSAPPPHTHPLQDERYETLDGSIEVLLGKTWKKVPKGEAVTVPKGTVHTVKNNPDTVSHVLNTMKPALDFEEHVQTMDTLVRTGKIKNPKSPLGLLYLSLVWQKYATSIVFANRGLRVLFFSLARVARTLGYRLP